MRGLTLGRAILLAIGVLIALAALALLVSAFAPRDPRREIFPLGASQITPGHTWAHGTLSVG
ncbi:MAG TPA: hypothetical protein PLJ62_09905 [Thermoflexales bacterium]|nr:hypothetical protein [Thermoflexales bacterium]HQW36427.1 hypothetical protein [Thermoflexales bacterium]HRA00501.1 hypothetical protein [Thermoflexales bacterium]